MSVESLTLNAVSWPVLQEAAGEGKKCRKVYGMENRTCGVHARRWKKACQRFTD